MFSALDIAVFRNFLFTNMENKIFENYVFKIRRFSTKLLLWWYTTNLSTNLTKHSALLFLPILAKYKSNMSMDIFEVVRKL